MSSGSVNVGGSGSQSCLTALSELINCWQNSSCSASCISVVNQAENSACNLLANAFMAVRVCAAQASNKDWRTVLNLQNGRAQPCIAQFSASCRAERSRHTGSAGSGGCNAPQLGRLVGCR